MSGGEAPGTAAGGPGPGDVPGAASGAGLRGAGERASGALDGRRAPAARPSGAGRGPAPRRVWCEWAWTGAEDGAPDHGVLVEISGGRITTVAAGTRAPADAETLTGLTLPGLANAHSHAFHRALRGRTHTGGGSFWTWREAMYRVADRLDPDTYLRLARAAYAEMALAGVTCVGEFHYLHHAPGGSRYADPNAMGAALVAAAADAGVRITLLDVCYLSGGLDDRGAHRPLDGPQRRFGDGDAAGWAERVARFAPAGDHALVGAAAHSVRAVPAAQLPDVAAFAADRDAPLHVHVSEQPAENTACLGAYGRTPTRVLSDAGALTPRTSLVHATHLTDDDVGAVRLSGATVCLCPTTERDLADGLPRTGDLLPAPLSLGTDQHAQLDLFEEARAVELHERLRTHRRGTLGTGALLRAATAHGHASLGWADAGALRAGARADLVNVPLDGVRLAGADPARAADAVVFAGSAADVRHVMADGRWTVRDGVHALVPDTARELDTVIKEIH
ncbi:formimidoylglutamate deiminase [Nocardiopsis sp. CT-R113]|uniref:Formimidoylglutamate deiminase n=1 Tax=Nocardiopsis codii TaxID=3065942 RepID=A0ABU7KFY3_9ACTN|nr:formimidoylglutamate deiminase [Nocardiopsis sp. CT-R113]MEE2040814.1 formimidoylglutamate deiminase [Nocardiopsis sp. CT-R113]